MHLCWCWNEFLLIFFRNWFSRINFLLRLKFMLCSEGKFGICSIGSKILFRKIPSELLFVFHVVWQARIELNHVISTNILRLDLIDELLRKFLCVLFTICYLNFFFNQIVYLCRWRYKLTKQFYYTVQLRFLDLMSDSFHVINQPIVFHEDLWLFSELLCIFYDVLKMAKIFFFKVKIVPADDFLFSIV